MEANRTNEELQPILDSIITDSASKHISDWLFMAKPNERKGLYIISKIIKHKGLKTFMPPNDGNKLADGDAKNLTMEEAFKRYQKKKMMSNYQDMYGASLDDKYKYNNILKYKEFDQLDYSNFVKKEYHEFIKSWVKIEKTELYKEYVLEFLRSFQSTIRSNRTFVTMKGEQFNTFKKHDMFTTKAAFSTRSDNPYANRELTVEELRARLNLDGKKDITAENTNNIGAMAEEIKKRKQELVNGHKNLLKGIYNNITTTLYNETFKGNQIPARHRSNYKPDNSTSMIKGLIPDNYTMSFIKGNIEINDQLKNTVRKILY